MYIEIFIRKKEKSTSPSTEIFNFTENVHVWHVSDKLCFAQSLALSKNVKYMVFGKTLVVSLCPGAGRRIKAKLNNIKLFLKDTNTNIAESYVWKEPKEHPQFKIYNNLAQLIKLNNTCWKKLKVWKVHLRIDFRFQTENFASYKNCSGLFYPKDQFAAVELLTKVIKD